MRQATAVPSKIVDMPQYVNIYGIYGKELLILRIYSIKVKCTIAQLFLPKSRRRSSKHENYIKGRFPELYKCFNKR